MTIGPGEVRNLIPTASRLGLVSLQALATAVSRGYLITPLALSAARRWRLMTEWQSYCDRKGALHPSVTALVSGQTATLRYDLPGGLALPQSVLPQIKRLFQGAHYLTRIAVASVRDGRVRVRTKDAELLAASLLDLLLEHVGPNSEEAEP